jgi:hypothetical protein
VSPYSGAATGPGAFFAVDSRLLEGEQKTMSNLPILRQEDQRPRQLARAAKAQRRAELEVFDHHLQVRVISECELIDIQARSDVIRTALDEEIDNLERCLQRAGGSAAGAELVARKIALQARLNDAGIMRHFGG